MGPSLHPHPRNYHRWSQKFQKKSSQHGGTREYGEWEGEEAALGWVLLPDRREVASRRTELMIRDASDGRVLRQLSCTRGVYMMYLSF